MRLSDQPPANTTLGIVTTIWSYYDFLPGWCESVKALNRQPDKIVIAAHDAEQTFDIVKDLLDDVTVVQVDEDFVISHYLNRAIEACDTDWIGWIGVDDRYRPHAFDGIDEVKSDLWVFGMRYQKDGREWRYRNDIHNCLHYNPIPPGSPFRRWLWEKVPFQTQLMPFEDWAFWVGSHILNAAVESTGRVDYDYAHHSRQIDYPPEPTTTNIRNWAAALKASQESA